MILKLPWILVVLVIGYSWTISSTSGSMKESTIMKTLEKLIRSEGKTCPKKLLKLCKKEPNFTQVLQDAVILGIENCKEQFKYTRWNCTLNKKLFNQVTRETSIVTAIFSASLSHTFARSCVGKKFFKCNQTTDEKYIWTKKILSQLKLPSDDIKFGRRMTKRILLGNVKNRMKKNRINFIDAISIHNVEVGIRQAASKMEENCNCNEYSSSCIIQICRKSLKHLKEVIRALRSRYTEAKLMKETDRKGEGIFGCNILPRGHEKNRFYYITESKNFCQDTHGRECRDEMNCSILCCARGFRIVEIKKRRKCRCVMSGKCCDIKCQTCPSLEFKYICK